MAQKNTYQQWIVSVKRVEGEEPTIEKLEKNFTCEIPDGPKTEVAPVDLTDAELELANANTMQNGLIYLPVE